MYQFDEQQHQKMKGNNFTSLNLFVQTCNDLKCFLNNILQSYFTSTLNNISLQAGKKRRLNLF